MNRMWVSYLLFKNSTLRKRLQRALLMLLNMLQTYMFSKSEMESSLQFFLRQGVDYFTLKWLALLFYF